MKKTLLFFLLFSLAFVASAQQTKYSRVKIFPDGKTPAQLFALGIEINQADPKNQWYMAEISQEEIYKLQTEGFRYEIIIPDLENYYSSRSAEKSALSGADMLLNEEWPQPENFELGSCGGFSTVDQMIEQIDLMRELFPSLISVKQALSDTITTIEGRTVYYVRISDNPDVNEPEPEVLYTGMHHAREPIGMQHLSYYMWYLLENYDSDPSVKGLVDSTEMYFVPVFNVDGYIKNITSNPSGGGMWRKNRRNNGDGSFGIDINRNYGYKWGFDENGSSSYPGSDLYRGTAAFSEPETRMMKYFCEDHEFRIALNYHSYSNLFLYPWGWSAFPTADDELFNTYANLMTRENNYTYGPANTTIYPTNGGSDDWMYGENTTKPAILAYTPEIGNNTDGFWPTQQRILPLIQENMLASLTAARLVGRYGTVNDVGSLFIYEQNGFLPFEVQRLGMQDGNFPVSVIPLGNGFASVGETRLVEGLNLLEKRTDSISYQLSSTISLGDTLKYVLQFDNGYFFEYDTVTRIVGYPVSIFNDDLSTNTNWIGNWALTEEQYFSPVTSMTDSPYGYYTPGSLKAITSANEIDLINTLLLVLQFRAKWSIENDYDFVQLSISDDNGSTWTPLKGNYTNTGTIDQASGQPVYDGTQSTWIREDISLNEYMGKKVKFRFRLKADQGVELDGFYFDDFTINTILDPTSVNKKAVPQSLLGNPYPNPATQQFEVDYNLSETFTSAGLKVITPEGVVVLQTSLKQKSGKAIIDISNLAPGVYFVSLDSNGLATATRKLIVR